MSKQLLQALIEKPTRYNIDVLDNSMLPKNLKNKKIISFEIKPPNTGTLIKSALLLSDVPEELFDPKKTINISMITPYLDLLIEYLCIVAWGKKSNYPDWYVDFIKANTKPNEVFAMFQEASLKSQTGFFLNSFQIASQTNPMMIK